jgi:esterase/lipase
MKKFIRFLLIFLVLVVAVYFLGPKPSRPELSKDLPSLPGGTASTEEYIALRESEFNIRNDNQSRIIWDNDSLKERTPYSLLYLHGFSASWYEGYPAHINFAKHFGMNAYFPRLASHGLETEDPLIDMTPDNLWESAKEALMAAQNLGRKVIIMGTSTGGTLALKLAADFPEYVHAVILYSPNIRINNSAAFVLSKPWGLQIGRKVTGGNYRLTSEDLQSEECRYWYCRYRVEGIVYLQQLVESTMKKETFSQVNVPVFLGYYYKDQDHQDQTVRVDAMLDMFEQLGTSEEQKVKVAFPEAGDHVIACELTSGSVQQVTNETISFGENILRIKPARILADF